MIDHFVPASPFAEKGWRESLRMPYLIENNGFATYNSQKVDNTAFWRFQLSKYRYWVGKNRRKPEKTGVTAFVNR
jgi:hypothetical protein